jgi:hypothetical protein
VSVRQVTPHVHWPSGDSRPIALLGLEPEDLSDSLGIVFEEGHDNLDFYRLAAIQLNDGQQVWLMRHRGTPAQGTEVYADSHADPIAARRMLLEELALPESAITWSPCQ